MKKSTIFRTIAVVAVFVFIFFIADYVLYPCTFTRNDIHAVLTEHHDDIFIGTSHGKMGICPTSVSEITKKEGHNLCVGGEYPEDAYHIVKLLNEKNKPERIIYEVSPAYFMQDKEQGSNYMLIYHEFPLSMAKLDYFKNSIIGYDFRSLIMPYYEYDIEKILPRFKDTVTTKINHDYSEELFKSESQKYHKDGFIERYPVDISGETPNLEYAFVQEKVKERNMDYLGKMVDYCKENNIEFVAVITPVPDETLEKYKENYENADKYFKTFFDEKEVKYYNFNAEYYKFASHDMTHFTDFDGHMNGDAAKSFSRVFAHFLK